jgi:competence protein ComFC
MKDLLEKSFSKTLDVLYPAECQICFKQPAEKERSYICDPCRDDKNVQWIRSRFCKTCGAPFEGEITVEFSCGNCMERKYHFEFARSAVKATEFMLEVVHHYKYAGKMWLEPFLGDLLVAAASTEIANGWDLVVPVPLHPTKEREREFNQAERLGACLSRAFGLEMNARALKRVKLTNTQTRLNRKERAENVENAFELGHGQVEGRCVILVDDVLTTGATTNECAKELKMAGAAKVCVWTVIRGTYRQ